MVKHKYKKKQEKMSLRGSNIFATRSYSRSSLFACTLLGLAAYSTVGATGFASEAKDEVDDTMTMQKSRELHNIMSLFSLSEEGEEDTNNGGGGKVPPAGLTMAEFHELISTDIHREFSTPPMRPEEKEGESSPSSSSSSSLSAEEMFHLATQQEWKRAYHAEERSKKMYHHPHHPHDAPSYIPSHVSLFLICDYCANKTALTAKREMEAMVGTFHMIPVRNDDERSCFMTQMPPSVADQIASSSSLSETAAVAGQDEEGEWCTGKLRVQPVLPEMKIKSGTVDFILDQVVADPAKTKNKKKPNIEDDQGKEEEQNNEDDDDDDDGKNDNFHIFYSQVVAVVSDDAADENEDLIELGMSILKSLKTQTTANLKGKEEKGNLKGYELDNVPIAAKRFLRLDVDDDNDDVPNSNNNNNHRVLKQQKQLSLLQQNERKTFWHQTLLKDSQSSTCQTIYSHLLQINPSSGSKTLTFSFLADEDTNKTATLQHLKETLHDATTTIPSCLLSLVATASTYTSIASIDFVPAMETSNEEAQWITQSNERDWRPFFDVGLTGGNQVVAVSDTGLDTTNCYFMDDIDVAYSGHRKVTQYIKMYGDDKDDYGGHGTHVCGTVAGRRVNNGKMTPLANGIARDAKIAFFDMAETGDTALRTPANKNIFLDYGASVGAKIHSASWGLRYTPDGSANIYGSNDRAYDRYMHDNDDFLFISAAGNSGSANGYDTKHSAGSPSLNKNGICVGASQSSGKDVDLGMLGKDYLAYFSSRGPSADGRTKPDIVAPGYSILSAKARHPYDDTRGRCDGNDGLTYMAGTSMATPVVSGTAALVRQYFEEGYYPTGRQNFADRMRNPSAALVKAVLLNGAQYLIAVQQKNLKTTPLRPYDNNQNFGRINLIQSLPLEGKNDIKAHLVDRKAIADMDSHSLNVHIDKTGCTASTFSATLVWTDLPGVIGCQKCLTNDLDLFIQKNGDGTRIRPNGKSDRRDSINNAERIRIDAEDGDELVVTVHAHDLDTSKQNYALVMTGCIGEVNEVTLSPTVSPAPTAWKDVPYSEPSSNDGGSNTGVIVGAVVGGIAGLCALICLVAYCRKKRDEREAIGPADMEGAEGTEGSDYAALSQDDETPAAVQGELT